MPFKPATRVAKPAFARERAVGAEFRIVNEERTGAENRAAGDVAAGGIGRTVRAAAICGRH